MVSDVRHKVEMRLRAVLKEMDTDIRVDPNVRELVRRARTDYEAAKVLRATMRGRLVRAFPGCAVSITLRHVSVYLPDRYPNYAIPIVEQLNVGHIECLNPKGFANKPFLEE